MSNTGCASCGELAMTLNTSAVVVCRSNASSSSRLSRTTSVSSRAAGNLSRCAAFVLRRRVLTGLPPALERGLIASPWAQDTASYRLKPALWKGLGPALCNCSVRQAQCRLWVNSCHATELEGRPLYPRKLPRHSLTGVSAKGQKQTIAHSLRGKDERGRQLRRPTVVVSGSEHRVVVRSRLRDRLDDIPVLDHLAVFRPVNVNDGFAARTVRQAVPMAVENDVIPVREDALDLAMRVRTIGLHPGDELAEPFHAVLDERIVLAVRRSAIDAECVLNVAFKDRLRVEGHCVGLVRFEHGPSFQGGLNRHSLDQLTASGTNGKCNLLTPLSYGTRIRN